MSATTEEWVKEEAELLEKLEGPAKIQSLLDSLAYNTDDIVRSPRAVLRTRKAHCLDGALLAAAILEGSATSLFSSISAP